MKKVLPKNRRYLFLFILLVLLPLTSALFDIIHGNIPFWYDNARDLLSAWDNLSNPTLIGPTTGVSGVYYGPYWIWLLSFGLLFTKDPRVANIVVGIIPYFLIVPILLYGLSRVLGKFTALFIWTFFIFNIGMSYVVNIWNPHFAPFLTLLLIYLVVFTDYFKTDKQNLIKIFASGLVAGLIINFHISFGIGLVFGMTIFLLFRYLTSKKGNTFKDVILYYLIFSSGLFLTFAPFILFEVRNGFVQAKTLLLTLASAGGIVDVEGLPPTVIIEIFFGRFATFLGIENVLAYAILILLFVTFAWMFFKKKVEVGVREANLILISMCSILGVLGVYLSAKNPVWAYHFIGVEIIVSVLAGFIIGRIKVFRYIFAVWLVIFLALQLFGTVKLFAKEPTFSSNTLNIRRQVVDVVLKDEKDHDFAFFAYSPSIYIYEYSYLFKWRGGKDFSFDPGLMREGSELVYIVVPKESNAEVEDFLHFRTPESKYATMEKWEVNNDIIVLRKEMIHEEN